MTNADIDAFDLPIELGDGLVLRRSSPEDATALADFHALVQRDDGQIDQPDERIWAWTYDLMTKPHPTFSPHDFSLVEETATGKIVSSMCLIPQTWSYAGIRFPVGRPELVSTWPGFRNRGLVRRQFDLIHLWSAERGHLLQAVTGIAYYYRQFGYEMALNHHGGRAGFSVHVPRLKAGEVERFTLRPAIQSDIPFLSRCYALGCQRHLVACERDHAMWEYELEGMSEKNVYHAEVRVIEAADGVPVGYITHPSFTWGDTMAVQHYELIPGISWLEVTPAVIRYLEAVFTQYQLAAGENRSFGAFGFWLGEDHPVYHAIPDWLPRIRRPYAFYLRLEDVAGFLRLVAPVLEERLAGSPLVGYSGEVRLTFYRQGLHLAFEQGRLVTAEAWKPIPVGNVGEAAFPPHTFLQLLFGFRPLEALKYSFPDCWTTNDEVHVLLDTLFPHQPSDVWPVS
ncbi:MAG: GNAT family N-acetyltransferase [Acidobacteriaceae bacterium]